jgi:hypothetical protein
MRIIKGVRIIDNRGADVIVDGVVSEDGKYVAAATCRSFVTQWKDSSTGSGYKTRAIGFGDIHVFRAENVKELEDGTFSADVDQIIGPLQIRVNEIDKGDKGKSVSINSFLDDMYGKGDYAKPYSKLMQNTSLKSAILHAIASSGEKVGSKEYVSRNSILAAAAKNFADEAAKADMQKPKSTQKEKEHSNGMTADENLPI